MADFIRKGRVFWHNIGFENRRLIKWLFLLSLILITIKAASAVPDGGVTYYDFSTLTDQWGANDATNNGATADPGDYPSFNITGDSATDSLYFDGSDNVSTPTFGSIKSVCSWFKPDVAIGTGTSEDGFYSSTEYDGWSLGSVSGLVSNELILIATTGGAGKYQYWTGSDIGVASLPNSWQQMCLVWSSANSKYELFYNGRSKGYGGVYGGFNAELTFNEGAIGQRGGARFTGSVDEFMVFTEVLTPSNISSLYNYGINETAPTGPDYFRITTIDAWDGEAVLASWAVMNSTNFSTANGTIQTTFNQSDTYLYDILVGGGGYVQRWYNDTNISTDLVASLYPYNGVNITFKYEDTYELAENITIISTFISDVYTTEANTTNAYLNLTLPYPTEYQIRYYASGYSPRFYTFTLTDGTYNELELLLPAAGSSNVTIYVKDTLGNPLENVTVKVLKFFPSENDYIQVASVNTNFEGRVVESIEIGVEFYQFILEYGGVAVLTTTPSYIWDDELTLYINLLGDVFSPTFARTGLYGVITLTGGNNFTFVFDDSDNLASQGCIYAYSTSWDTLTEVNNSCATGAAGSTFVTVANTTGLSYLFRGYITKNGVDYYITSFYYKYGEGFDEDGNGLFLVVLLILSFALIGFWRLEAAVLFAGLATLLVSITGLVNVPITYTAGIFVLSLVTAFIINKRRAG